MLDDGYLGKQCGPYQLIEDISLGSYAYTVLFNTRLSRLLYKGYDESTQRYAAVLILDEPHGDASPETLAAEIFKGFAQVIPLQHPNIAPVFTFGQSESLFYVVGELLQGEDLALTLLKARDSGIPLESDWIVEVTQQVAAALDMIHAQKLTHSHVQPQRIIMSSGTVRLVTSEVVPRTQEPITNNNPLYIAPEIAVWSSRALPQSDQYSLAACVYEMLTFHPPFDSDTSEEIAYRHLAETPRPPSEFNTHLTRTVAHAVDEVILKALEKDPKKRYASCAAFADALAAAFAIDDTQVTPETGRLVRQALAQAGHGVAGRASSAQAQQSAPRRTALSRLLWAGKNQSGGAEVPSASTANTSEFPTYKPTPRLPAKKSAEELDADNATPQAAAIPTLSTGLAACVMSAALVFPSLPGLPVPLPLLALPLLLLVWAFQIKSFDRVAQSLTGGDPIVFVPLVMWGIGIIQTQGLTLQTAAVLLAAGTMVLFMQNAVPDSQRPLIGFAMQALLVVRLYVGLGDKALVAPPEWGLVALALGAAGMFATQGRMRLLWLPGTALALGWLLRGPALWPSLVSGTVFITSVWALGRASGDALWQRWGALALMLLAVAALIMSAAASPLPARAGLLSVVVVVLLPLLLHRLAAAGRPRIFAFYIINTLLLYFGLGVGLGFQWAMLGDLPPLLVGGVSAVLLILIYFLVFSRRSQHDVIVSGCAVPFVTVMMLGLLALFSLLFNLLSGQSLSSGITHTWLLLALVVLTMMMYSFQGGGLLLLLITAGVQLVVYGLYPPIALLTLCLLLLTIGLWHHRSAWFIGLGAGVIMLMTFALLNGATAEVWYSWPTAGVLLWAVLLWQPRTRVSYHAGLTTPDAKHPAAAGAA